MTRVRRALSLVEVLVVLSITGALIAMLLPAVQKVRGAAKRLACQSNMRQIATATHNYESTLGHLPPAFRHRSRETSDPNVQWPLLIAPHLELDANARMVTEDFRKSQDPFLPVPHRGVSLPLKAFSCPSDPRTAVAWEYTFIYTLAQPKPTLITVQLALNSYLGNGGAYTKSRDGVIVADGRMPLLQIEDGSSNTLMFGERPPPANLWIGWLYVGWGATGPNGNGELASVIGVLDPNPFRVRYGSSGPCGDGPFPYREPVLNSTPDCAMFQYWSLHSGGANFAFADGSVRFLPYSADAITGGHAGRRRAVEIP
ncbi:MAG: DUF1559 domain-containing protein [Gemmataceae bacterium]